MLKIKNINLKKVVRIFSLLEMDHLINLVCPEERKMFIKLLWREVGKVEG